MKHMSDKYQEWLVSNKGCEEPKLTIVKWLFTLMDSLLEKHKLKLPSHWKISMINNLWLLLDTNLKATSLDEAREGVCKYIELICNDSDDYEMLFGSTLDESFFRGVVNADSKALLGEIRNLNIDDTLDDVARINIDLTLTQDYYWAQKSLMGYYKEPGQLPDIEKLSEVLNDKDHKFEINHSNNKITLKKLQQEILGHPLNDTEMTIKMTMNKLIHAIRIGSTARGSSPTNTQHNMLGFWGLDSRWQSKVKKAKHADIRGANEYQQRYGGAGNIVKGLAYIQKKVSAAGSEDLLYKAIEDKIRADFKLEVQSNVVLDLSDKTLKSLLELGEPKVRQSALIQMIRGYQKISTKPLTSVTDKIIELLTLYELQPLINKLQTLAQDDPEIEKIYTSCIDLMSTLIVLQLGDRDQSFIDEQSTQKPKDIIGELVDCTSFILVGKSGQNALSLGLKTLEFSGDFSRDETKLPGFQLKTVLSRDAKEEEKDIAVYFEVGSTRGAARKATEKDQVAAVGRISETIFDISAVDLLKLTQRIQRWCAEPSLPKTLCVDLTIRQSDDNLVGWLNSDPIKELIREKTLNILVWQSEQKQQSLGSGKFSAGSSYLISNNEDTLKQFNTAALKSHETAPDHNISTFFRTYCTDASHEVVRQQMQSAQVIAEAFRSDSHGFDAVANGPFVCLVLHEGANKLKILEQLETVWPHSGSFGFSHTTTSHWDDSSIRISVGLEDPNTLRMAVEKIQKDLNGPLASNRS